MKALQFDGNKLRLVKIDKPTPAAGEALVRVSHAGICNTDLEILKGYMQFRGVPGHEFVGVVEEAETPELVGKRVVGEINLACGKCAACLQGMGRHCPERTVLGIAGKNGAFAEYLTLPEVNLHVVPEGIPDLAAVFVEPLAAACEITEQLDFLPGYRVLLLGDGKLAQLIARVLCLEVENLLVVGKHPPKLDLLEKLGIRTVAATPGLPDEDKFDVVVEATGSWEGWQTALQAVRPRGFVVLKSTYVGDQPFNLAEVVINEISIIGSRCGPFSSALHLLRRGVVQTSDLISERLPLAEWQEAFRLARQPDSLKIIIDF